MWCAAALRLPPRVVTTRPRSVRRFSGEADGDLARLREEIAALEADLATSKRESAPDEAPPPPRSRRAPLIVDGSVDRAAALGALDASLLPEAASAAAERRAFGDFCLLGEMEGAGLIHAELGGARFVTVDGSEPLVLLLSGLEDVNPGDDVDVDDLKKQTDRFVETLGLAAAEGSGDADAVWKKVGAAYEDDDAGAGADAAAGDDNGGDIFGIDLDAAASLSASNLARKVDARFAASLADHWTDWCAVAREREDGEPDVGVVSAALEKYAVRIAIDAVSSSAFAAAIARNATFDDEPFSQRYGLFEVAFKRVLRDVGSVAATERTDGDYARLRRALRVAAYRTEKRVEVVREIAGYFFERVGDSPARDLVLEKLKQFDLVPEDETDPEKLRDAFIDAASSYFTGAVNALSFLSGLASFAAIYALFALVLGPLAGGVADGVGGVFRESGADLGALGAFLPGGGGSGPF